ncbi:MAG: TetR family transcriptional regulator [Polyangiales bacterium]
MATTPKTRSAPRTRAAILAAARSLFAQDGYDRTSIRAVAAAASVDPALVLRYFDNKVTLFAEAADFHLPLPDLSGLDTEAIARALVDAFFQVWESDGIFLALLRASATSEEAAERMRRVFQEQVVPALAKVAVDQPGRRAALVGSQVIGFAFARYVLRPAVIADMTRDEVLAWLGPTLVRYLTAPAP